MTIRPPTRFSWILWQLLDSAFPVGGFVHSSGLEVAYKKGLLLDENDLIEFLVAVLDDIKSASLPYALSAYREPEEFEEIDEHCDVFLSDPITNRASRRQGLGLLIAVSQMLDTERDQSFKNLAKAQGWACHYAPCYGWMFRELGLPEEELALSYLFLCARTVISAAIRLNVIGPLRAQWIFRVLSEQIEQSSIGESLPIAQDYKSVVNRAPLLNYCQCAADRLYSRLFQS